MNIIAKYVFENIKYLIGAILFLKRLKDFNIKFPPKNIAIIKYTIPSCKIGAAIIEIKTVAHEYIEINLDVRS